MNGDLYLINFGGAGDDAWARQDAERAEVRRRHVERVRSVGLDRDTAERVVATIFDHAGPDGSRCVCGCHPQLSTQHDGGMDCSCAWDESRRAEERVRFLAWRDSPASRELARLHDQQERAIADWVGGQIDMTATRTTSYAPEQWEGTVDGHSFYFRERHGDWHLELDLQPSGHCVNRFVGTDDDGRAMTETVELDEGTVIAEGVETELGDGPVEHLEFIVRTIRDHLREASCQHVGALRFCPECGMRTAYSRR